MYVDAVDHQLASPPLGAVDQLGVPRLVRDGLELRRAEGVAAGGEHFHAHGIGDFADRGEGPAEVLLGFGGCFADAGHEFHGVEQQFLLDVRVFVVLVQLRVLGGYTAQHLVCDGG